MNTQIFFRTPPIILLVLINLSFILWNSQTAITAQTTFDCNNVTDGMAFSECEALVTIYNTNSGADWQYENGIDEGEAWLQTTAPCSWYGIACNDSGNVTDLNLGGNNGQKFGVVGALSPAIGDLSYLRWLTLTENEITNLPAAIGNLTRLVGFSIWNNQLTTLPPEIGSLTRLGWASFSNNRLTTLPPEIGNLADLTWLSLSGNQLSSLPAAIGDMSRLVTLYLSDNQLNRLPPEITTLSDLRNVRLEGNLFSCTAVSAEPFASWRFNSSMECAISILYLPIVANQP